VKDLVFRLRINSTKGIGLSNAMDQLTVNSAKDLANRFEYEFTRGALQEYEGKVFFMGSVCGRTSLFKENLPRKEIRINGIGNRQAITGSLLLG